MINFIQNLGTDNVISIGGGIAGVLGFVLAYFKSQKVKSLVKLAIPILINVFKFFIANRKALKKVINIEELKKLLSNMKGKVENDTTVITNSAEEIKTTNAEVVQKTETIVEEVKKLDDTIQSIDTVNTENKENIEKTIESNGFTRMETD